MPTTLTHLPVTTPSATPSLETITELLRQSNALNARIAEAVESIAGRELAVREIYQAGWKDCTAVMTEPGMLAALAAP